MEFPRIFMGNPQEVWQKLHLKEVARSRYYHSGGCREQNITISAELDDLGNFGASMDEMGTLLWLGEPPITGFVSRKVTIWLFVT